MTVWKQICHLRISSMTHFVCTYCFALLCCLIKQMLGAIVFPRMEHSGQISLSFWTSNLCYRSTVNPDMLNLNLFPSLLIFWDHADFNDNLTPLFLDLQKCFDSIGHSMLLLKRQNYGISGLRHDWFKSYLNNRSQVVCCNWQLSKKQSIKIGVPQWSSLGPTLVLIFTNDYPSILRYFKCHLFANDPLYIVADLQSLSKVATLMWSA